MASHTKLQREFIVRRLAAFEPPKVIAASFVAAYPDTVCTEQDVLATDPETQLVDPDLLTTFLAERERVLLDPKSAPFANQTARLIALSNDAKFYGSNNQLAERRAVFRQIAEELGVIGGKAGKGDAPDALTPAFKSVTVAHEIVDPKLSAP